MLAAREQHPAAWLKARLDPKHLMMPVCFLYESSLYFGQVEPAMQSS